MGQQVNRRVDTYELPPLRLSYQIRTRNRISRMRSTTGIYPIIIHVHFISNPLPLFSMMATMVVVMMVYTTLLLLLLLLLVVLV